MKQVFAGIDIGGTKIAIALATPSGEIVAKQRLLTQGGSGPFAAFENVSLSLEQMLQKGEYELAAIGVGSPAPIDIEKGLILSPSNLREWDRFPIVGLLNKRFRVAVKFDNDANAAVLGEFIFGAGRGCRNIFYITVSTGIGGGVIINGEVYHGTSSAAGEIGHTIVQPDGVRCNCGSFGCLETICAGVHIARRVRERIESGETSMIRWMVEDDLDRIDAQTVVDAVRNGDRLAIHIWDETCRYLAIGIANAVTLLAPEIVIVGGGIAAAGELLFARLREQVPRFVSMLPATKIKIVPAELGTESGIYGALALARGKLSNSHNAKSTQEINQ